MSRGVCAAALAGLALGLSPAQAAPLLRCEIESTGEHRVVEARLTDDPYRVAPVAVNRHFRFRAWLVSDDDAPGAVVARVLVQWVGETGPVPLQQASYRAARPAPAEAPSLTGLQWLYSPVRERRFAYECRLLEVAP